MRRYLVLNDTMLGVSKSNKRETYQQKITNSLINERHVLVDSYLCTRISRLLNFNIDDMTSFDINEILTSCNKENLKC